MQESLAPVRNLTPSLRPDPETMDSDQSAPTTIKRPKSNGKIELSPKEIYQYYRFGTNYLLKNNSQRSRLQSTFDPQSLSLYALAHAIDSFSPEKAQLKSYTFKSHYVFKLRRYADRISHISAQSIQIEPLEFNNIPASQLFQTLEYETMRKLDINAALNSLPQSSRRIVINYHYYGHDLRTISLMMQIPYSALRIQYKAAMARLRYLLSCYEFD